MDYKKIHDSLIERAKNRVIKEYTEKHHIVPRCMGGNNEKDNMVRLTPEEHFLVHQLLVKIYPENHKLTLAVDMMCASSNNHGGRRANNKRFGWLRRRVSESLKKENIDPQTLIARSNSLKGRIISPEARAKLSEINKKENLSPETLAKRAKANNARKGIKLSLETRKKLSASHKKPINQYSKDGEFIQKWDGAIDAAKALGLPPTNITACLKGKQYSAGNSLWKYA